MNKPIIREPSQRLPIDDMWNIVEEVGNPKKEGKYLILSDCPDDDEFSMEYLAIWSFEEQYDYQAWTSKGWCGEDPPYAWMELPQYRDKGERAEE